jgi:chemotaxis protein CheD
MKSHQFILPGDYFFGEFEGPIVTLLGSCVAVTLWHPQRRLVAVSHFLLSRSRDPDIQDTRYGEGVFQQLQQDMRRYGTKPEEFRKGLFGGGSRIRCGSNPNVQVGANNVRFAREQFQRLAWRIDQEHLGGKEYRRLTLDGRNGMLVCQCLATPTLLTGNT